ncbi:MAG TPA: AmmeMemoRadiSam system protein A [Candidatus Saccharimonadales bacterium]|jgi:AmmeMemoRadiSam system protein A|nr:AmmeMemoRadiSam system protein A [Candidatus Saccharimonadales bacterium]
MPRLSSDDWQALAEIAHRSISSAIITKSLPDLPPFSVSLSKPRGAFVTLYCGGDLRGCVGQVENPGPLADVVAQSAISAALYDTRFPPISSDDVAKLKVEISVLSVPECISPEAIVVGKHGLLVMRERSKGLLLPQVAMERKWSAQRFLEETCVKAGLSRDAWRDPETKVFGFTADIYSEKEG